MDHSRQSPKRTPLLKRVQKHLVILCGVFLLIRAQHLFGQGPLPSRRATLLTEQTAILIARQGNRQVQESSVDVGKSLDATKQAKAARFPQSSVSFISGYPLEQVNFTIPKGSLGSYPSTGPIPGTDTKIKTPRQFNAFTYATVAQPLTQLYKIHFTVKSAELSQTLAALSLRKQSLDTINQVRRQYYAIVLAQTKSETHASQIRYLNQLLATTQDNFDKGAALQGEVLQVTASLKQEQYLLSVDEDDLVIAKETLNRLLGRDIDLDFAVELPNVPDIDEIDGAAARQAAFRNRPEIQQARTQTQKANLEVRREKSNYIPDVNLQLTYLGFQGSNVLPPNITTLGASFTWNDPWDWGARKHQIAQLRGTEKQQQLSEQDTLQQVTIDVDRKWRSLKEARLFLATAEASKIASEEVLREVTNQYQAHAALLSDALRQQALFTQQSTGYRQAVAAYWTAKAELDRALGED